MSATDTVSIVGAQPVKICTGCHMEKTLNEFSKKGDRLRARCRACCSAERRVDSELAKRCRENKLLAAVNQKRCNTCNMTKLKADFYETGGESSTCVECIRKQRQNERAKKSTSARAVLQRENVELAKTNQKKCSDCKQIKSRDDFYDNGGKSKCRACLCARSKRKTEQKRAAAE
jgi:hypothetical protein